MRTIMNTKIKNYQCCECYRIEYGSPVCLGTMEKDKCSCDGDPRQCTFYPEKRTKESSNPPELTFDRMRQILINILNDFADIDDCYSTATGVWGLSDSDPQTLGFASIIPGGGKG